MANQRGIVAGWDTANARPKGVTSAADMRASLQMIATHPGIVTEPGAATITLPSNAMRINWTAFTAVIRSTLGGWYTPRIEAGGIALSIGHGTYPRLDVVWVRQRDYQTNSSWPDSEVEVGVAQGTASATPSTPAVPTGALAVFTVLVPAGATTGSAIGLSNVTAAPRTAPAGGVITAASQAEMDALAAAAGAENGLNVWRSDTKALMRYDGAAWTRISPRKSLAGSALDGGLIAVGPGQTSMGSALTITCDGTEALVVVRANRIRLDGSGAGFVGVRLDGVSVGDERRVYSSWGAFSAHSPDWMWPISVTPGIHTVAVFVSTDTASENAIYLDGSGIICWNI